MIGLKIICRKVGKQVGKDYLVFPALRAPAWKHTLYWAYMVIFCGNFPGSAEKFTREEFENETQAEWYLRRQMLGSANFHAGPLMAFMSGNLCYQIEHHLFPDLPNNRYAEIGERVRALCDKYDLPYTTRSLGRQYMQSFGRSSSWPFTTSCSRRHPTTRPKPTRNLSSASAVECGPSYGNAGVLGRAMVTA
jgi:NADPH-dependent stearoyl-CoA 9-desaturase